MPKNAVWIEADQEWEAGGLKNAKKHGPYKYWRADGTLCNECMFAEGLVDGPFKRYHENGETSQEGMFLKGKLHGTRVWFATAGQTSEKMHEGGVSEKVWRSEMDYELDRVIAVRHYDQAGDRVLPDGTKYPDRPRDVPRDGTEFRPDLEQWVEPHLDEAGERHGTWRAWTRSGEPACEAEYQHGARHGRYLERVDAGAYERGYFDEDLAVEQWALFGDGGKQVWAADLGVRQDSAALAESEVFDDVRQSAEHWEALAQRCLADRRVAEAALAMARAAAAAHSVEKLDAFLREHTPPRPAVQAEALAQQLAPSDGLELGPGANALLRGATPSLVLRAIAVYLDQHFYSRAALDFVNAAILLAPDHLELLFTRSLVLMSLGLDDQARNDANALAVVEGEQAEFLLHYLDALFPTFDWWPGREAPSTSYDGLPEGPDRTIAEVKEVVQKLATRVQRVRKALLERIKPEVRWLLPELGELASGTKVKLERTSFQSTDADGQPKVVEIDEDLKVEGLDVPRLMRLARAEWGALTWLCWACGLDRVEVPIKVAAPKDYGLAAGMAQQRLWRSRDLRVSGPREVDSPSFQWEGMAIEEVPVPLAAIAEAQYADMQAMFYWLTDKTVRSPWQDNVRES
ncbi:MAG: thiol reductase thioredoxin [Archangiaceae bacterium]|nr:thiol reductase thioredoxin [Archangiaceae bacterium]